MKRIFLTLALAVFAFSANAQFIISANIGGSKFSGDTTIHTQVSVATNSETDTTIYPVAKTNLTAGLKLGYKFGKAQVGVSGSYSMYNLENQPLDPTVIPMISSQFPTRWATTGFMSSKYATFTVAPYFRYDILTAGDIALFVELNLFYTSTLNPVIEQAHVYNYLIVNPTLNVPLDTNNIPIPRTTTQFGARIIPGITWQLAKNCGFELYMDFLSLAYTYTKSQRIDLAWQFNISGAGELEGYTYTATTTNSKSTEISGGLTGTPLLTEQGVNNWVRAGFYFSF
jgi:hypothetical protein